VNSCFVDGFVDVFVKLFSTAKSSFFDEKKTAFWLLVDSGLLPNYSCLLFCQAVQMLCFSMFIHPLLQIFLFVKLRVF